jgi:hypothetical protein
MFFQVPTTYENVLRCRTLDQSLSFLRLLDFAPACQGRPGEARARDMQEIPAMNLVGLHQRQTQVDLKLSHG